MNTHTPAFDSIGVLDLVIYTVLVNLSLTPIALKHHPDMTIGQACESNAAVFLRHFDGTPIRAIKAIRDVTGFDLRSAKEAHNQIRDTYSDADTVMVRMAVDAIDNGDTVRARSLLTKHLDTVSVS